MIKLKTGLRTSDLRTRAPGSRARKKKGGLKFQRFFSQEGNSPFDEIEWERRVAEITDDSGKVIFRQEDVEVPKSWSALATKIAVSKYFYGDIANGTDPYAGGRESSVRQLIHRVTRTISDWGLKDGYFSDQASAEVLSGGFGPFAFGQRCDWGVEHFSYDFGGFGGDAEFREYAGQSYGPEGEVGDGAPDVAAAAQVR